MVTLYSKILNMVSSDSITNLGTYELFYKKTSEKTLLVVHKGVYWESENYILTQKNLVRIPKKIAMKRILDFKVSKEDAKENDSLSKVSFKIDGAQSNLKVHAFAFNTIHKNGYYMIRTYVYLPTKFVEKNNFRIRDARNQYLSNKKLNDEVRYALERKYLKSFIGTTLERPSLLFKKKYVCDTYFNAPTQAQEVGYQNFFDRENRTIGGPTFVGANRNKGKKGNGGHRGTEKVNLKNHLGTNADNYMYSFLNFLDTPPCVMPNLKNKDGVFSFDIDTNLFTNLIILAIDDTSATQKFIDLDRKEDVIPTLKIRTIALDNPLDSQKSYQETRNAIVLGPNVKHIIDDITSVDYQTIDSVQKVGQVLQELLRLKHEETQPFTTSLWLYNWINADKELKNKKYSMHMCNEFNFFLYFKDKEYFEDVVRPSIAAKVEKTLIDYFLLEQYDHFEAYRHVSVYDSLNALEQCLLIAVTNMKDPAIAKMLADQFINRAKLVETSLAKKNQKFDTVLLMKILESEEVDGDDEGEDIDVSKKAGSMIKKQKMKRQRSMSMSGNSSCDEMNWNQKHR
jgi:hypothetical protein